MAAILNLEVKIVLNLKNSYFIGFFIKKIVKFDILYIVIHVPCLVPKLSYIMFFKIEMAAILELRGQDVPKSEKKHFIAFATKK